MHLPNFGRLVVERQPVRRHVTTLPPLEASHRGPNRLGWRCVGEWQDNVR
jgi:hypothetical protein